MNINPFKKRREALKVLKIITGRNKDNRRPSNTPHNLFVQCKKCDSVITSSELKSNLYVCSNCGCYFKVPAYDRINMIMDKDTFKEFDKKISGYNPLRFPGYDEKIKAIEGATTLKEAVVTGKGKINGSTVIMAVLDSRFLMGSMGTAVGEKITRAVEYATKNKLPLIIFSASGGARMQEGIFSLMQMAKTSAAIEKHNKAGLLYISVLTHPTTGGVTASFASLGDIILAEPGALIGFAGPRVIEETIKQKLPEGFQTAEYLKDHGFVDNIVSRSNLRSTLSQLLMLHNIGGGRL